MALPPSGPFVIPPLAQTSVRLSVVLPTYQESSTIITVIERLASVLNQLPGLTYEMIVVDDDSPDRTWELALAQRSQCPHLRVMRREGERGLASAVFRGWQVARGEILGVMDADLQHPPEIMSRLLAAIDQNADIAVASRHVAGGGISHWNVFRRLISRSAQWLGVLILPEVLWHVTDPMSGFFLVRRKVIAGIETQPLGYKILLELLARARPRQVAEIGYVFEERPRGKSKVCLSVYLQYLKQLLLLRRDLLSKRSTISKDPLLCRQRTLSNMSTIMKN